MKSVAVLLLLALCASAVAAKKDKDSKVVVLTEKNFDEFIAQEKLAMIEFYAPWCGHCKALAPEYDTAAEQLEGKDAGKLAKVDCTVEKEVCNKFEVQGFPTIKIFRNDGSNPTDYDGPRKADGIVKFMQKQNSPAVTKLADASGVADFASGESTKIVLFADADDVATYTKVAQALRNEFSFAQVKGDATDAAHRGSSKPYVVMYRDFDEGPVTNTADVNDDAALTKWIRAQSFPLIGEIGPENYAKYLERGFNFVWIFVDYNSDEQKQLLTDITPVARDNRDKLSFVKLDGVKWEEHAKSFGLSGNTPGIVLENREKRKNFVFPEDRTATEASFREFIDGVLSGKIQPNVKSEPIPESNDGPVKVVVGHTFNDIVMDNSKDVLVEFYAPWCGHCKSLAPKYDELGKLFKDDSTVVIAKIDSTANDSPAEIQGFPTIILYPAGDKENPINFEGDRTAKAMKKFIEITARPAGDLLRAARTTTTATTGTATAMATTITITVMRSSKRALSALSTRARVRCHRPPRVRFPSPVPIPPLYHCCLVCLLCPSLCYCDRNVRSKSPCTPLVYFSTEGAVWIIWVAVLYSSG